MFDTQSERDFYNFCREQGWIAQKLEPVPHLRTPDFKVSTQTGYEFIAEVTEFEPDLPEPGQVRVRDATVGNAIRMKLSEKKGQVRQFAGRYPTVIVIAGGIEHLALLDEHCFDSALYGELTLSVRVPQDVRRSPEFDDGMHNAGRRFFGPEHNRSISAVAALDRRPQFLRVFHNRYARISLEPMRLLIDTTNVQHFIKRDGGAVGWEEVGA